ncbi:hypothetical protein DCC39_18640 [Pueribacillus theae]|uniref:GGDEF domain-containing protein n=1 Tax=Pueribacillus theae TaxID=2171751 RepID=A0A2U1JI47_9BACI|nr:diguanylate cyclase [Pueribacillus theae]PWA04811.1 hypothetical protein DCC39_18640 [Pueribacillus theae]
MFQSILSNLAILLLGHLLMSTLMQYRERLSKSLVFICIVLLFSGVIITMFYLPIQFGEYRLDLRLIPLIFLSLLRGWKITLPILVIASIWRLFMGGDGAIPGIIFGMIMPTLFALAFYNPNKNQSVNLKRVLIITGCWFISDFPIIFIFPNGMEVFKNIFLIRYISFLGVAFIYYTFVLLAYKNEALKNQLKFLASHDPLTKLLNRSTFVEIVEEKINDTHMNHYIAIVDIDYFKQLNDTYGHLVGDNILIEISSIFKKYECENVKVARYGGEEFIIYLKAISTKQAIKTIEGIQDEIRTTLFQVDDDLSLTVTVSIGLAMLEGESPLQDAIKQADTNLYLAKERGRDQLVVPSDLYITLNRL